MEKQERERKREREKVTWERERHVCVREKSYYKRERGVRAREKVKRDAVYSFIPKVY
jgi:hypothetical protein